MHKPALVLLVDDEKDFRDVLEIKIKASGFNVVTASNGEEAVALAKERLPDLILMDVKMPKMDGLRALEAIKNDASVKNIKVVMLTAFGDPQPEIYQNHKRFAQEMGATEYFLKTQDLDDMINKVKDIISKLQ